MAQKKLIEQRPLIRKYWSTAGELVDLFKFGEVWISNTWAGYQSSLLAAEGIKVVEFIPKENAEGWMDSFMTVKGTTNEKCAYKFLNMMTGEAGQCGVANVNGYSVTNPVAAKNCMSEEQFTALHQDDPDYLDSLLTLGEPRPPASGLHQYLERRESPVISAPDRTIGPGPAARRA
ncbi:extracellular solute-binding protein [Breoghania sp.]|uniref:extracellular solute-binding protein n=1 Tax=Breoghania sp. TaxID=2065378 RepID=UPI002622D2D2|nr:extracellular solute-binding protein [Breoghania sp.]MDJ0933397.1 extracellular solute-binding protein [Breoghania sp.]